MAKDKARARTLRQLVGTVIIVLLSLTTAVGTMLMIILTLSAPNGSVIANGPLSLMTFEGLRITLPMSMST